MSRRNKEEEHVSHERWLVSYADFITLLFAFFVVLYASAQVDNKKIAQVAAAIAGGFQKLGVFSGTAPGPIVRSEAVSSESSSAGVPLPGPGLATALQVSTPRVALAAPALPTPRLPPAAMAWTCSR